MGKLTDLLKRAGRTEPEPMGFGSAARQSHPTVLLVAIAGDHWARAASEAIDAGADALLLAGRPSDKDVEEAVAAAKDHACGLLSPDATAEQLQRLREAGLDFAVIGPGAPAAAIAEEKLTLAFHLHDDLTDVQLRTLDSMPFDAIYVERDAAPVTIMRLVELRRIAALVRKPLLFQIAPDSTQADVVALRDAGIALVAVDMKERSTAEAIRKLREMIDGLPRRRVRREDRLRVALPRAAAESADEEEEEDG
jgi:hypothetical protein